jgi:hypothetical protein
LYFRINSIDAEILIVPAYTSLRGIAEQSFLLKKYRLANSRELPEGEIRDL